MIRDPSDGSVRENKPVLDTNTSGLPPEAEAERARMDRSRKWLEMYRTNPEYVIRRTGEQGPASQGEDQ